MSDRTCTEPECDAVVRAKGLCSRHYFRAHRRARRAERPSRVLVQNYWSAHRNVRRTRGYANDYPCIDCGGEAHSWSLNHDHPSPRLVDVIRGHELAYSMDPAAYDPRCNPCHRLYDRGRDEDGYPDPDGHTFRMSQPHVRSSDKRA